MKLMAKLPKDYFVLLLESGKVVLRNSYSYMNICCTRANGGQTIIGLF